MSVRSSLRAFGFGLLPCMLLGCMVMLLGWTRTEPVAPPEGTPTPENLSNRAALLRSRLPARFSVHVASPFIVIAETSAAEAVRYAHMVDEQSRYLQSNLFTDPPDHMIDVWLFADRSSYRAGVRDFLEDWPRTMHGFYSPKRRAVVVNLASGDTTLRHELVHPFVQSMYPDVAPWIDEGIASLFETTRVTPQGLKGVPGAQLGRLQNTMLGEKLPSIAALSTASGRDFYGDPRRLSYAQSRYVMMFLQRRNQLSAFFSALGPHDPTGFRSLMAATGFRSEENLQAYWEAFVLSLETSVAMSSKN